MTTSLSVLVPVYNEEYLVAASLERLKLLAESPHLDRAKAGLRQLSVRCGFEVRELLESTASEPSPGS